MEHKIIDQLRGEWVGSLENRMECVYSFFLLCLSSLNLLPLIVIESARVSQQSRFILCCVYTEALSHGNLLIINTQRDAQ